MRKVAHGRAFQRIQGCLEGAAGFRLRICGLLEFDLCAIAHILQSLGADHDRDEADQRHFDGENGADPSGTLAQVFQRFCGWKKPVGGNERGKNGHRPVKRKGAQTNGRQRLCRKKPPAAILNEFRSVYEAPDVRLTEFFYE